MIIRDDEVAKLLPAELYQNYEKNHRVSIDTFHSEYEGTITFQFYDRNGKALGQRVLPIKEANKIILDWYDSLNKEPFKIDSNFKFRPKAKVKAMPWKTIGIAVNYETYFDWQALAKHYGTTVSNLAKELLLSYLDSEKAKFKEGEFEKIKSELFKEKSGIK